jgi:hypothetical protein
MAIRRSPLKDRPLRNPGQSLDEQIHDLIETNIGGPLLLAQEQGGSGLYSCCSAAGI